MSNTISDNLIRLNTAKNDIASAIVAKGGTVGENDGFEDFPNDIASIPTGSSEPSEFDDVVLYDIDGTIVASYTKEEFLALEDYPTHPDRTSEGLTSDGWTLTFQEAQDSVRTYGIYDIGAMYVPTSGCTEVHLEIPSNNYSVTFCIGYIGSSRDWYYSDGSIDWGDGTSLNLTSNYTTISHTYNIGNYIVKFKPISKSYFGGYYYYSGTYSYPFLYNKNTLTATKKVYFNIPGNCAGSIHLQLPNSATDTDNNVFYVFSRMFKGSDTSSISSIIRLPKNNPTKTLIIASDRLSIDVAYNNDWNLEYIEHFCTNVPTSQIYYTGMSKISTSRIASFGIIGRCVESINDPCIVKQAIFKPNFWTNCSNWLVIEEIDLSSFNANISSNCFNRCYSLKRIIIGPQYTCSSSATNIFFCPNLEYIKFTSSTPLTSYISYFINSSTVPNYVPKVLIPQGSLSDYVSATSVDAKYFEEY